MNEMDKVTEWIITFHYYVYLTCKNVMSSNMNFYNLYIYIYVILSLPSTLVKCVLSYLYYISTKNSKLSDSKVPNRGRFSIKEETNHEH